MQVALDYSSVNVAKVQQKLLQESHGTGSVMGNESAGVGEAGRACVNQERAPTVVKEKAWGTDGAGPQASSAPAIEAPVSVVSVPRSPRTLHPRLCFPYPQSSYRHSGRCSSSRWPTHRSCCSWLQYPSSTLQYYRL